ncbi:MAG: MarR family transcriptional regulator [Candidatus Aminicenantes bacterium]|nr:MarR family transcriptional regulator [Candidatus Aminicenantes bacterium]
MDIERIRRLREKLRQLERAMDGCFRAEGGCCGLTLSQCHTLLEVGYRGEVSLIDLATTLGLDPSNLSRTVNGLVLLGLINRMTSEKDRRYVAISLTGQGKKVFDEIESIFSRYYSGVLGLIPDDKKDVVVESIALFADAVREFNDANEGCNDKSSGCGGRTE